MVSNRIFDFKLKPRDFTVYCCLVKHSDINGVLSDAAYLAADITGIIDDDAPIEDCTTRHFPSEHKKKNSGPVMGGM